MVRPCAVTGFLTAVLALIATRGASLALLIQHVTDSGRRQALPVILGTPTGLYLHATLAMADLSGLVMHSSQAFTAIKLIGAGYLMGLGILTWRSAAPTRAHHSRHSERGDVGREPPGQTGRRQAHRAGKPRTGSLRVRRSRHRRGESSGVPGVS
ncbi:LysE family translocator [Streptomyces sp. NPDC002580]|uniref:LysE family translocator n=1 Tax=Streptomyces sp. NPDC002580 TaxID=3364653 RepID=UPI0036ABE375